MKIFYKNLKYNDLCIQNAKNIYAFLDVRGDLLFERL